MALISIKHLTDAAKARGFRTYGGESYVELFAPDHVGPDAVRNWDSIYSTCTISLYDRPRCGYGYNPFFYGPWHTGYTQSDDFSVKKLLAHPAMQDVAAA
jgi:hypothetical protein